VDHCLSLFVKKKSLFPPPRLTWFKMGGRLVKVKNCTESLGCCRLTRWNYEMKYPEAIFYDSLCRLLEKPKWGMKLFSEWNMRCWNKMATASNFLSICIWFFLLNSLFYEAWTESLRLVFILFCFKWRGSGKSLLFFSTVLYCSPGEYFWECHARAIAF